MIKVIFLLLGFVFCNLGFSQPGSETPIDNISIAFKLINDNEDLAKKHLRQEEKNAKQRALNKQLALKNRDIMEEISFSKADIAKLNDSINLLNTKKSEASTRINDLTAKRDSLARANTKLSDDFEKMKKEAEKIPGYKEEVEKLRDIQFRTRREILKRCNRIYFNGYNPFVAPQLIKSPKSVSFDIYYYPIFDDEELKNGPEYISVMVSLWRKDAPDREKFIKSWPVTLSKKTPSDQYAPYTFFYESNSSETIPFSTSRMDDVYFFTVNLKKKEYRYGISTPVEVEITRSDYFKIK